MVHEEVLDTRAMVVKNGFEMSETTSAIVLVCLDRSCRASALGTYPSSSTAAATQIARRHWCNRCG